MMWLGMGYRPALPWGFGAPRIVGVHRVALQQFVCRWLCRSGHPIALHAPLGADGSKCGRLTLARASHCWIRCLWVRPRRPWALLWRSISVHGLVGRFKWPRIQGNTRWALFSARPKKGNPFDACAW